MDRCSRPRRCCVLKGWQVNRRAAFHRHRNSSTQRSSKSVAERKLDAQTFAEIAGSERAAFDRITFRPRLMIDTRQMDLTTQLFGQSLFTPILIGPLSRQKRFHPEGELAMARGASAAKALLVVSDDSSYPIDQIAAQAKTPLWYQINDGPNMKEVRPRVERAIGAGCKALCVTIGGESAATPSSAGVDWKEIDRLSKGIGVPRRSQRRDEPGRSAESGRERCRGNRRFQLRGPLHYRCGLFPLRCCRPLWMPWVGRCRS